MTGRPEHGPPSVLIVDDEEPVRRVLERFLRGLGYEVRSADSVDEARRLLTGMDFDVVVTDLKMPGESGLDLLSEIGSRWPRTRGILMSGRADLSHAAAAIERRVDRLLLKPFDLEELHAAVEISAAEGRAQERAAREREMLEAIVRQRETTSRIWVLRAAHALAKAVEAKDAYTAGHASRVAGYARRIAEEVGAGDLDSFHLAAQLHDVGKMGVPDHVLNKPGPLDEQDLALVRRHPELGARILEPLIDDATVIAVVRSHHEHWDGGGYPDGLAGDEIPRLARVLAVADTIDAMTSTRAYRERLSWEVAVAEIRRESGSRFDPAVVAAFEAVLPDLRALHDSFHAGAVEGGPE